VSDTSFWTCSWSQPNLWGELPLPVKPGPSLADVLIGSLLCGSDSTFLFVHAIEMEAMMNPKLMWPVGIATLVFCGVFTVRNFTRDPYAELQAEEQQAEAQQAERMRVKYRASDAYRLTFFTIDSDAGQVDPDYYNRSISDDLGDAILAAMLERVKPHGINRSYGPYDEPGDLGTITVRCTIGQRNYHGQGPSGG